MNLRAALAATLLLATGGADAGTLEVTASPCAKTIRVDAQDVPLRAVLERLARDMQFTLHLKAAIDDPVSLKAEGTPERVLRRLMEGRNLVLDTGAGANCGGRDVVRTVWALPAGQDAPRPDPAAAAAAAGSGPTPSATDRQAARKNKLKARIQQRQQDKPRKKGHKTGEDPGQAGKAPAAPAAKPDPDQTRKDPADGAG